MTDAAEKALKQKYIQKLPTKMTEIDAHFEAENFANVQTGIHKLAGSAGMYGFAELSSLAADIEELIVSNPNKEVLKIQLQRLYDKVNETIADLN